MKARIFICLMLMFAVLLCGCSYTNAKEEGSDEVVINMPTDDSLNGYRLESNYEETSSAVNSSQDDSVLLYYANTNSKKFHKNSCRYAKMTSNENLYITESKNELINEGYVPCKVCEP